MNARKLFVSLVTGALLALAAQAVSAGWEDNAHVFGGLFGSNSTAVVVSYMEDGSFYIEDEFGNTYTGCQLTMPCDNTVEYTKHIYMPAVGK